MAAKLRLSPGGYTGFCCLAVSRVFGLLWQHMAVGSNKGCDDRLWAKKLFLISLLDLLAVSAMMSIDFTAAAGMDRLLFYLP
jgi:protoheme IX farnesyltransferase